MKSVSRILFCLVASLTSHIALAQTAVTVSQAIDYWASNTETRVVSTADAMPEEKYSFAPSAGEFTGVRTFGEQVKHLSACNYRMAAYILKQTPTPDQESEIGPADVQTKAQIMEYVRGSYAALHRAIATVNARNAVETLTAGPGPKVRTRLQIATLALIHANDHYGQMVEYSRMNGIIPPPSRK